MKCFHNRVLTSCFFLMVLFVLTVSPTLGEEGAAADPRTIIVQEGQNVRDLAKIYLDDPNLWIEILRVNDLNSPADVKPDMTLKLPDPIINKAANELRQAQAAIDEASKAGAKIFAPGIISDAIQLQNDALAKRKAREWQTSFELARAAFNKAKDAVEKSLIQGDTASQATLIDRKGTVQSRKPSDQLWNDLPINSVLVEGEKVRTLSASYAEIQFKDSKRVRLSENSQIVISKMQAKILKSKEETSVSLMKGDAYMLLSGKRQGDKKQKLPPTYGKQLPPPKLISPENGKTVLFGPNQHDISLKWEDVSDASSYWLEIATDRAFKHAIFNQKDFQLTDFRQSQLKDGVYYWRVAAVDGNGFPGTNSRVRFFKITSDTDPPYLIIHSPGADAILADNPVKVHGKTEQDAILSFDGTRISVSDNGAYQFEFPLSKGLNDISIKATDRAGNVSELSRSVFFDPNTDVDIHYDPDLPQIALKHFITHHSAFTLTGRTEPNTAVRVHAKGTSQRKPPQAGPQCFADDDGRFQLTLPIRDAKTMFILSVMSPGGHVTHDTFMVESDTQPPEIRLANDLPAVSSVKEIPLVGSVSEKSSIWVNSKKIQCDDKQFDVTMELDPGVNTIRLMAQDQAGNISFSSRKVILDLCPPKYVKFNPSPKSAAGGESINISVLAKDESDLKEAAEFEIQAGEYIHAGFLKLNNETNVYQGIVNLPEQAKGDIRLNYVVLSDYNGNEKKECPMK